MRPELALAGRVSTSQGGPPCPSWAGITLAELGWITLPELTRIT